MELDELKAGWNATNSRLDQVESMQAAMNQMVLGDKTRKTTNGLKIGPIFELVASGLTVLWSGRVVEPDPDRNTSAILEHNRLIADDDRFVSTIVPTRDGVFVALRVA